MDFILIDTDILIDVGRNDLIAIDHLKEIGQKAIPAAFQHHSNGTYGRLSQQERTECIEKISKALRDFSLDRKYNSQSRRIA